MVAGFNGPILWLPAMLSAAGGSDALAARSSLIVGLFMLPAGLLSVLLIDRAGRRPLLLASLSLAFLGTFGLAVASSGDRPGGSGPASRSAATDPASPASSA